MNGEKNNVLKFVSLGLLIPHTICYTLLAAVARKPDAQGHVFFGPSAVVMMELGKLIVSLLAVTHHVATSRQPGEARGKSDSEGGKGEYIAIANRSTLSVNADMEEGEADKEHNVAGRSAGGSGDELPAADDDADGFVSITRPRNCKSLLLDVKKEVLNLNGLRLIPPALLYVCQNNLQVFASGNLTPAEYQVVGQTKLAFTAIFSVLILSRKLNLYHWLAIATLSLGTIIVQTISATEIRNTHATVAALATDAATAANDGGIPVPPTDFSPAAMRTQWSLMIGTVAMLGASACSGLGGVLVEVLLKKKMHFWTTNVHLAFFSLVPAVVPVVADSFYNSSFQPLRYFNMTVWSLIALNMLGGIIASMTMKYADNILKNFAVAISLIGTVYLSAITMGISVTFDQIIGTALVVAAIAGYARA